MAHLEVTGAIWVRLVFFLAHQLLTCMALAAGDPLPHVPDLTDFRLVSGLFVGQVSSRKGNKESPPSNMFDSLKIYTAKLRPPSIFSSRVSAKPEIS